MRICMADHRGPGATCGTECSTHKLRSVGSGAGGIGSNWSLTNTSSSSNSTSETKNNSWAVTLMYSYKNGRKILRFMEAGKDFVDVIFSLLTLPLGSLIQLLYGGGDLDKVDGAIFRAYQSVENMDDVKFCTPKSTILDPVLDLPEASEIQRNLLTEKSRSYEQHQQQQLDHEDLDVTTENQVLYSCGMIPHCVYITRELARRCPLHGRRMQTLCRFVPADRGSDVQQQQQQEEDDEVTGCESGSAVYGAGDQEYGGGYVKDGLRFYITDALEIHPETSSKLLTLMQNLQIGRLGDLSKLSVTIGKKEILKLFKASLTSTAVLSDVFGSLLSNRPPRAPPSSKVSTKNNNSLSTISSSNSMPTTRSNNSSLPSTITKSSNNSLLTTKNNNKCWSFTRGSSNSLPTTNGSNSLPTTKRSNTSLPSTRSNTNSLPPTRNSNSILCKRHSSNGLPTTSSNNSLPTTSNNNITSLPTTSSNNSLPTPSSKNSLPSSGDNHSWLTTRSSNSSPTTRNSTNSLLTIRGSDNSLCTTRNNDTGLPTVKGSNNSLLIARGSENSLSTTSSNNNSLLTIRDNVNNLFTTGGSSNKSSCPITSGATITSISDGNGIYDENGIFSKGMAETNKFTRGKKLVFASDEARVAFMVDKSRPKYDDYFPRPVGSLFWYM